jgi:hypothetical protein
MALLKIAAILALSFFLVATLGAQNMKDLSDLQWRNRIVLVKATGDGSRAMESLKKYRQGIEDRDIAWFVVTEAGIDSNLAPLSPEMAESVRGVFETQPGEPGNVILIGKDGGVKDRSDHLALDRLFAKIDRMPMRKQEMRRTQP